MSFLPVNSFFGKQEIAAHVELENDVPVEHLKMLIYRMPRDGLKRVPRLATQTEYSGKPGPDEARE